MHSLSYSFVAYLIMISMTSFLLCELVGCEVILRPQMTMPPCPSIIAMLLRYVRLLHSQSITTWISENIYIYTRLVFR